MTHETECKVAGCGDQAHAKGYCRRHYGQIWRKGKIYVPQEAAASGKANMQVARRGDETDRMRSLEREFRRAEMMYRNVVGVEGRLKWRREIAEVKKEMARLGMPVPLRETGHQAQGSMAVGF